MAVVAPGAPVSVGAVCFEQAENKNALAAIRSGRVEAIGFFTSDSFLELLKLLKLLKFILSFDPAYVGS